MSEPKKEKDSERKVWYSRGLRFSCEGCGKCCSGEPGYVWVTPEEILAISEFLKLSPGDFAKTYLRLTPSGRVSFREKPNGDCVFLERPSAKCLIYPVRPTQCRTYPFWPEILRSKERWEEESSYCPGIGNGKLWPASWCSQFARETSKQARRTARKLPNSL